MKKQITLRHTAPRERGFTIVELLIVIVVIGILAAITIVSYNGIQKRARTVTATAAVDQWEKILRAEITENGELPLPESGMTCLVSSRDELPDTNTIPEGWCAGIEGEPFVGEYYAPLIDSLKSHQQIKKINFPSLKVRQDDTYVSMRAPIISSIVHAHSHNGEFTSEIIGAAILWFPETAGDCGRGESTLISSEHPEWGASCRLDIDY